MESSELVQRCEGMDYAEYRAQKDRFFAEDHHSPLPRSERTRFAGLRYFPPAPDLAQRVMPEAGDGSVVEIATSDGQVRRYRRAATVEVEVDGETRTLTLLGTDGRDGYFLPFRDETSGTETYGAGRYLDLETNDDGTVDVDFNLAYNPYCAYDDCYSCPLPPHENWLDVPIRAGEMNFTN